MAVLEMSSIHGCEYCSFCLLVRGEINQTARIDTQSHVGDARDCASRSHPGCCSCGMRGSIPYMDCDYDAQSYKRAAGCRPYTQHLKLAPQSGALRLAR